jgi:hypothetical protein
MHPRDEIVSTTAGWKRNFPFRERRAGGEIQVVQHLPSKCKALTSNPSTMEKERKDSK